MNKGSKIFSRIIGQGVSNGRYHDVQTSQLHTTTICAFSVTRPDTTTLIKTDNGFYKPGKLTAPYIPIQDVEIIPHVYVPQKRKTSKIEVDRKTLVQAFNGLVKNETKKPVILVRNAIAEYVQKIIKELNMSVTMYPFTPVKGPRCFPESNRTDNSLSEPLIMVKKR